MRLWTLSLVGPSLAALLPYQPVLHQDSVSPAYQTDAVKEAFQHAWDGYSKYAFPHDELHPVSNGYGDSRSALSRRTLSPST